MKEKPAGTVPATLMEDVPAVSSGKIQEINIPVNRAPERLRFPTDPVRATVPSEPDD